MAIDIPQLQASLEAEKQTLEKDLAIVARHTPGSKADWEVRPIDDGPDTQFNDEVADNLEDMEEREATEIELEARLANVNLALQKISAGTYGQCEVCQTPIEPERLGANAAARTCIAHRDQEKPLRV